VEVDFEGGTVQLSGRKSDEGRKSRTRIFCMHPSLSGRWPGGSSTAPARPARSSCRRKVAPPRASR
jgi:hypothetical protein